MEVHVKYNRTIKEIVGEISKKNHVRYDSFKRKKKGFAKKNG